MPEPRLFSVPVGLPFLKESVRALLENKLIPNADMSNPAELANLQIYVPSKKVAQVLRSTFVETTENQATLLPNIRPLGESEGNENQIIADFFNQHINDAAEAEVFLKRPALIGTYERQALLARLIRPWRENLPQHIRALFGDESIKVPANTADALWLARDLAALMDEIETENINTEQIKTIAHEDLAQWWQVTLEFLQPVFAAWPQILTERNVTTAAAGRNRNLREEAKNLVQNSWPTESLFSQNHRQSKPVLVLGSTGSVPAVAELIKTVSYLPQGAVVLPGLDRDLEKQVWQDLDKGENNPAAFAHPQYSLKRLLQKLNADRQSVIFLGNIEKSQRAREKLISELFRPAESTEAWQKLCTPSAATDIISEQTNMADNFAHISLVEAPTMREEALAIAVAMRATLETPNKTTALITGDRQLARRVCSELARFGVAANDSGGIPLGETELGTILRLLLDCVFNPGNAVALLGLLKHPLTRLGFARADLRHQTEQFEFFALRGGNGRINIGAAESFMEERLQKLTQSEKINNAFTTAQLEQSLRLASLLTASAAPLCQFASGLKEVGLAEAVTATIETLENFGRDEHRCLKRLYAQEQGQKLIGFCRALLADNSGLRFFPQEWPQILQAFMADETVEMRQSGHPRLFILGLFEARLQNFDTVLIGGLNEGSLPRRTKNSPFMSRSMKAAIGLPPPEQKIGFTAHDIAQNLGMNKVILTRALRVDNAPSVASRWLQRLQTIAGNTVLTAMKKRGSYYLNAAQNLDNAMPLPFAPRPCPKPPLKLRPNRFSITEIEILRGDPYALYARRILRLKPLEPLIRDAGISERGTFIHAVMAAFSQFYGNANIAPIKKQAAKQLENIAAEELAKLQLPADIAVLWWPRLTSLIPHYIEWEANLSRRQRFTEISATPTAIGETGCFLHGRADRIDILTEKDISGLKLAEIIDFKTGSNPNKKWARLLRTPQLALEAALLKRGAFADCGKATAEALYYVRLKANGETTAEDITNIKIKTMTDIKADELAEKAWQQLIGLISYFQKSQTGYPSHALPKLGQYESDYDHLARVSEWSTLASSNEESDNE